jgi:ABC-2 type transport system permease protein
MVGIGLLISTKAETRDAAGQMAMGTILPAVFLSGYVFPLDLMPTFFQWFSQALPTTWLIDASRAVILRGAGWPELWKHALVLSGMAIAALTAASLKMRKSVG